MKEILLFSGGMDSFIAWHYLNRPNCLFVNLGHRYAMEEEFQSQALAREMGAPLIIWSCENVGSAFEAPDAHIPLRNMLLATMGAMFADTVYVVCQEGERSIPDRSTEFFQSASDALTVAAGTKKKVDPVFWNMTKVEMVKWYLDQGFPKERLLQTWSCFTAGTTMGETPCAKCAACFRRAHAFLLNGIEEDWYDRLRKWDGLKEYRQRLTDGHYEGKRAEEMDRALGILGH